MIFWWRGENDKDMRGVRIQVKTMRRYLTTNDDLYGDWFWAQVNATDFGYTRSPCGVHVHVGLSPNQDFDSKPFGTQPQASIYHIFAARPLICSCLDGDT